MQATETLYSGPCAREMVKKHLSGAENLDQDLWEAFVFYKFKSSLKLANKSVILCQVLVIIYCMQILLCWY